MTNVPNWITDGCMPEAAASRAAQYRCQVLAQRIAAKYPQFDKWVPIDLRNRTSVLCSAFSYPMSDRLCSVAGMAAKLRRVRREFQALFGVAK